MCPWKPYASLDGNEGKEMCQNVCTSKSSETRISSSGITAGKWMHEYIKPYPPSSVQRECSNFYSKMSLLSLIKENYSCFLFNLLVLIVMQDRRYKRHQFSFSPGVLNKKAYSATTIVHFIGLLHSVRTYSLPSGKPKQLLNVHVCIITLSNVVCIILIWCKLLMPE